MIARWICRLCLVAGVVISAAGAGAATAAADCAPLWSFGVAPDARVAADDDGAAVVWAETGAGASAILSTRLSRGGTPLLTTPQMLASGIVGLGDRPLVVGDADDDAVIVVWKAQGVVYATRAVLGGPSSYAPVPVSSDAAAAALRGVAATVTPVKAVADGAGGAYVLLRIAPSSAVGDTLLVHVSATGSLAVPTPGHLIADGTAADLAADESGSVFVLLGAPGRSGAAVQRFDTELRPRWDKPVMPYNPIFDPVSPPTEPLAIDASEGVVAAWREGAKVGVQRFADDGRRLWPRPLTVAEEGSVTMVADTEGGCYLLASQDVRLRVHHVLASRETLGGAEGFPLPHILAIPHVAAAANRAGDLDVAYQDDAGGGLARLSYTGAWTSVALAPPAAAVPQVAADGSGGAYVLAPGTGALLWHLAEPGVALTLRSRALAVTYGQSVACAGYATSAGEPVAAAPVAVRWTGAAATTSGGATHSDALGFYRTTVTPTENAQWQAVSDGATSEAVTIGVSPVVTLALGHRHSGSRLTEHFTGAVRPAHPGAEVRVQRRANGSWVTVATAVLDSRSRYRAAWQVPARTATYALRVVLPAHQDHLLGASPKATLRVVVRPPRRAPQ